MKYITPILFLIIGIAIGFYWGGMQSNSKFFKLKNDTLNASALTKKLSVNQTEVIYDTIVKEIIKPVKINNDTLPIDISLDTNLTTQLLDSALVDYLDIRKDTLTTNEEDETIKILKEQKIGSKNIEIIYLKTEKLSKKDSLLNQIIEVEPVNNKSIIIEFWESPIDFKGYKMSKSKIIVYGLEPQLNYDIYYKNGHYYLNLEQIYYELEETVSFKPFKMINEKDVFND